jgi:parallel beta-helix repeat protein
VTTIQNITGGAGNPVVFKNRDNLVIFDANGNNRSMAVQDCSYIQILGNNKGGLDYGLKFIDSTAIGIRFNQNTDHWEVGYCEICDTGASGLLSNTSTQTGGKQVGIYIHHCYIHDVAKEGLYIGDTNYPAGAEVREVEIAHNLLEDCGWDGIQVSSGDQDIEVHHNIIRRVGQGGGNGGNTGMGIVFNRGTTGDAHHNYVHSTRERGIYSQGLGNSNFYNNVVIDAGQLGVSGQQHGIAKQDRSNFNIYNNTVVNSYTHGIYTTGGTNVELRNNIVIDSGGDDLYIIGTPTETNNLETGEVSGFVDAGGDDYHLTSGSEAVNAGYDTSPTVTDDYDGVSRPQGAAYDVGAYEYAGTVTVTVVTATVLIVTVVAA